jgi:hypothetical protein
MLTNSTITETLIDGRILTPDGLDLSPLKDATAFGRKTAEIAVRLPIAYNTAELQPRPGLCSGRLYAGTMLPTIFLPTVDGSLSSTITGRRKLNCSRKPYYERSFVLGRLVRQLLIMSLPSGLAATSPGCPRSRSALTPMLHHA